MRGIVAGIFVGGRSSRMGGRPKGLIEARPGTTLVGRWRALFDAAGLPCVLVGANEAYANEAVPMIPDASAEDELGPLGGLLALFDHAEERLAIAVACDMPFVSEALLRRLVDAPEAPAVAVRRDGRWEPFFARYDPRKILPIARSQASARRLSLQALLDAVAACELTLEPALAAELRDLDTPEDVARMHSGE
jgi:molybdenum cofactor guanylyltransferase